MKLTESDRRLLATLGSEPQDVSDIVDALDRSPAALCERLDDLADNGLVTVVEDGRYRRTESGRRLLRTGDDPMDVGVDDSPELESAIAAADLEPDAAEAVRGAYAFLRYWGEASTDELIDALYPEWPAGIDSPEEWVTVVVDVLAELADVVSVDHDGEATPEIWRYAGTPEVSTPASDGFLATARRGYGPYGSVKHAIEFLDRSTSERDAVRAAFGVLRRRGTATPEEITAAIDEGYPAVSDADGTWWDDIVAEAFEELPNVERLEDGRWHYDVPPTE